MISGIPKMNNRQKAPTVGVEPTTFGLEVQRASPLRHAGMRVPALIYYFL